MAASAMPVPSTTAMGVGCRNDDRPWLGPTTTTGCEAWARTASLPSSRRIGPDEAQVVAAMMDSTPSPRATGSSTTSVAVCVTTGTLAARPSATATASALPGP